MPMVRVASGPLIYNFSVSTLVNEGKANKSESDTSKQSVMRMTAKIISIESRRCCDCGKPLPKESEHYWVGEKQIACSNCWVIRARRN